SVVPTAPVKAVETPQMVEQTVQATAEAQPSLPVQPAKAEPIPAKPTSPVASPAVVPAREPVPWGDWMKKLNPLKYLPTPKPTARHVLRAKVARTPVQAELSLEKVKVVRNDLSDTDLEIMAPKA